MADVVELVTPIAEARSIAIDVRSDGPIVVHADPLQLQRALTNIAGNAIRHSPAGGTVHFAVDGRGPMVTVRDEGEGFAADFVEEAFEPFRRHDEARDRAHGGAGLGLAVAKGIVDALGGRVWAEPGPGGIVHVKLSAVD